MLKNIATAALLSITLIAPVFSMNHTHEDSQDNSSLTFYSYCKMFKVTGHCSPYIPVEVWAPRPPFERITISINENIVSDIACMDHAMTQVTNFLANCHSANPHRQEPLPIRFINAQFTNDFFERLIEKSEHISKEHNVYTFYYEKGPIIPNYFFELEEQDFNEDLFVRLLEAYKTFAPQDTRNVWKNRDLLKGNNLNKQLRNLNICARMIDILCPEYLKKEAYKPIQFFSASLTTLGSTT